MASARAVQQHGAKRRRPANRRDLIIAAAAELFYTRGYDQVAMSDIAVAVEIVSSAMYRHFPSKEQLLHAVIETNLAPIAAALDSFDSEDLQASLDTLARQALEHRYVATLWQRDARRLATHHRAELRDQVRGYGRTLAGHVAAWRPELGAEAADLLAWSTASVLGSISFHHLHAAHAEYVAILSQLASRVMSSRIGPTLGGPSTAPRPRQRLVQRSRREAVLTQAVRMFADQGYTGVGLEDIGAAVGIAGPSIYNHFESKSDLLVTALDRATAYLQLDVERIFADAADPGDALRKLIRAYAIFTRAHPELVDLLITETPQLPADDRRRTRHTQLEYIAEWVALLQAVHPELDEVTARIHVHAALTVMNDTARIRRPRNRATAAAAVARVCESLLDAGHESRS